MALKQLGEAILLAILLFATVTLVTMKNDSPADGIDAYGFPFAFYDYFCGKCTNCYDQFGFKPSSLAADIVITILAAFIIVKIKSRLR